MSRTRLDEIVDEVQMDLAGKKYIYFAPEGEAALHIVAERAFRHGVERGVSGASYPAPAEEKCSSCGHSPHPTSPCSSGGCDGWRGCMGRRKGQRRKLEAEVATVYKLSTDESHDMFHNPRGLGWYYERRSGNDRRKS